ncbi:MAG: hypothetical protein WCZ23_06480 [Rhodospirillaceae bacterium]
MTVWMLIPSTHDADPRWQDRPIFSEVLVRAETAGMARRLAARFELGMDPDDTGRAVGNSSEPLGSALEDEKLYQMLTLDDAALADDIRLGPPGVLRAVPALRPMINPPHSGNP